MPAMATVFRWLREKEKFKEQYARAKEEASDALVEEIQDIADDGTNDYMEMQDGENLNAYRFMGEHVQRSKLRVEARKWIASKQKPKKYGEKMDFTSGGERISGFADLVKEANGQDDGESDSGDTGEDTD